MQLTGTLGDVMKESAGAALSYARSRATQLRHLPATSTARSDIHVHIPAGATPKDGPSGRHRDRHGPGECAERDPRCAAIVAMTGEITLRGRVLPIGGVKEKAVGAHRAGVSHVLLPKGNARDLDDVPQEVKDAVTFHTVAGMDEVLALGLRLPSAPLSVVAPVPASALPVPPATVPPRRERGGRRAPVHPH